MSKQLAGPTSGSGLAARLTARVDTNAAAEGIPSQPAASRPPASDRRKTEPAQTRGTQMDRRSWYMPKESAEALAQLVDELHWETRRPKHEILAELVQVALAGRDKVAKKLSR